MTETQPVTCPLCRRPLEGRVTRHHLYPQKYGRRITGWYECTPGVGRQGSHLPPSTVLHPSHPQRSTYSVTRLPVFVRFLPLLATLFWVADADGSCSEVRMMFSLTQ
jgi:hypothetical protein